MEIIDSDLTEINTKKNNCSFLIWWGVLKQIKSTMADFFFFTDVDLLDSQTAEQAYGPAGVSGGKDRFRITSIHSATGTPKAYAICDGQVAIQQDSENANIVHLILKPNEQPFINCSRIKYIIYKGINKESLLDGDNILFNLENDLTKSIHSSWDAYILSSGEPISIPSSKSLGLDLIGSVANFGDNDPIDNLFYRDSSSIQFPLVRGGWIVGTFDKAKFGIEIVTDDIGSDPLLCLSRRIENFISVNELTGSETDSELFKHWHNKESILHYIDPSAFFGMFYASKLKGKTSVVDYVKNSKNEVYDFILKGNQHKEISDGNFFNRNVVYLDVRNEHNQSFNYYKNYGTNIKLLLKENLNEEFFETVDYYNSGWPILILNKPQNPIFELNNSSSKNILWLSLPKGDNEVPLAYISQGYPNNFNPFKNQPKSKKKFIELTIPNDFTSAIELAIPNRNNYTETTAISCIVKVRYLKKTNRRFGNPPVISSGTTIRSTDFMDCIFPLNKMKIPFHISNTSNPKIRIKIYDEEVYIDWLNERGTDFVAKIGIAEDENKITFFAFAKDIHKSVNNIKKQNKISFASGVTNEADDFLNLIDQKEKLSRLSGFNIPIESENSEVQVVKFVNDGISVLQKFMQSDYENEFLSIVLDKGDYNAIMDQVTNSNYGNLSKDYKIFIGLNNKYNSSEDEASTFQLISYDIVIKGFLVNETGSIEAFEYLPIENPLATPSITYKIYN